MFLESGLKHFLSQGRESRGDQLHDEWWRQRHESEALDLLEERLKLEERKRALEARTQTLRQRSLR